MGMSASQARYLALTAQKSNLEYQGQQINQERTILAQQVSELYNSLLTLEVPTPPSTAEFSKTQYVSTNTADAFTLDPANVKPAGKNPTTGEDLYNVTLGKTFYGSTLKETMSTVVVNTAEPISGKIIEAKATVERKKGTLIADNDETAGVRNPNNTGAFLTNVGTDKPQLITMTGTNSNGVPSIVQNDVYFLNDDNEYQKVGNGYTNVPEDYDGDYYIKYTDISDFGNNSFYVEDAYTSSKETLEFDASELANIYVIVGYGNDNNMQLEQVSKDDCTVVEKAGKKYYQLPENEQFFYANGDGDASGKIAEATNFEIGGSQAMTLDEAVDSGKISDKEAAGFEEAIKNYGAKNSDGDYFTGNDFYIYFSGEEIRFVLKNDVHNGGDAKAWTYEPNGKITKEQPNEGCKLQFDTTTGRITSMQIPVLDKETNEVISWETIELKAQTVTDELAYQDAMAQYEYKQYLYDREQEEINAKTDKIQQMDRNLELKLQRLDTNRQQITTELESLKKVLGDNIQASYKAFSG